MTFELRLEGAGGRLQDPPLLTAGDLSDVKAVTRSAWYVLSGSHKSTAIILTVKPQSLDRWLNAIRAAARRGARVAIVVDGRSVGTMVLMQTPTGAEFEIDAAFFSSGTESDRANAARKLASAIKKSVS
ncbi:MAG: hypothetical protein ABI852_10365 [Gemmatimonadaceae bacterium]